MELIKRKILLEKSTDRNYNSPTWGTVTATTFYINVMLTQDIDNIGIFTDTDFIPNENINQNSPNFTIKLTGLTESDYYSTNNQIVTGITESILSDVQSYSTLTPFQSNFVVNSEQYIDYLGNNINGTNQITSLDNPITYVFDTDKDDPKIGTINQQSGLLYQDLTGNTTSTSVSYIGQGWNGTNISLSALTKEEYLYGITDVPTIENDVFIDRGIATVNEKHFKLSEVTNLGELSRYGKGYFNLTHQ
jgi:hypothetical protein